MSTDHHHAPAEYNPEKGLGIFLDRNAELKEHGHDMTVHQAPTRSVHHCSDSRQKAELATGENALNDSLENANPGGFVTDAVGNITNDAGRWLELTTAYGIDKAAVVQHSGCGQMNVLYTYFMVDGGKQAVIDGKGPFFANDAETRKPLIDAVKKNGLAHYESMGIPLVGTDADKFQQAMAIQQLETDMKAIEATRATNHKLPQIEGQFHHLVAGRFFRVKSLSPMKFDEVFRLPAEPESPKAAHQSCCCHNHK